VKDRHNGLLVSPGDEEALTQALVELLDTPTLCTELADQGRQTVIENFDVDRNVKCLFELFRDSADISARITNFVQQKGS
jgi:glycosyltransferase involved in cell wall biosynthesis